MSLVRSRRRRNQARRPRARQGQGPQERTLGVHHFEASPPTSVSRNYEATREHAAARGARRPCSYSYLIYTDASPEHCSERVALTALPNG